MTDALVGVVFGGVVGHFAAQVWLSRLFHREEVEQHKRYWTICAVVAIGSVVYIVGRLVWSIVRIFV